ncbi:MAG: heat-inducible transcription repressor HrcA [Chloroflexi bacterium]|nr:heat-inducible transcription repressor HrcA [Chloroflexota bacterium]
MEGVPELTNRRQRILKRVIEEYVVHSTPVASELIARKYESEVSSATVRNDLAALEELGFIWQPHTSAGRVPSDTGYRYYVERLMEEHDPPLAEQRTIRHQFHQVEYEVDRWTHLAASVLANALRTAAVVSAPLSTRAKVRRVELVQLQEMLVLLALLLHSGGVRQQLVRTDDVLAEADLPRIALRLNQLLDGRTAAQVQRQLGKACGPEAQFVAAAAHLLQQADEQALEAVYYQGLSYVLGQPEFALSEKLRPVVEVFEHQHLLGKLLAQALAGAGVQVIIGAEHELEQLRETAVILTRYGEGEDTIGVLAVVGPTRLPYWRAVPMLRFMGEVMDVLVRDARPGGRVWPS